MTLFWREGRPERVLAGMVLRFKDGVRLLVGDVNELLGECDDCRAYREEEIVAWARVIDRREWDGK